MNDKEIQDLIDRVGKRIARIKELNKGFLEAPEKKSAAKKTRYKETLKGW